LYTAQYTDKKESQIFLIYKEIQNGAVAKSDMTNGLLMYGEIFAHFLIRKPFLIHDFATGSTLNFLIYEENLISFISAPYLNAGYERYSTTKVFFKQACWEQVYILV
jgi:hypothetical protein